MEIESLLIQKKGCRFPECPAGRDGPDGTDGRTDGPDGPDGTDGTDGRTGRTAWTGREVPPGRRPAARLKKTMNRRNNHLNF